jgi:hypothetical protein
MNAAAVGRQPKGISNVHNLPEHCATTRRQILGSLWVERRAVSDLAEDLAAFDDDQFGGVEDADRVDTDVVVVRPGHR